MMGTAAILELAREALACTVQRTLTLNTVPRQSNIPYGGKTKGKLMMDICPRPSSTHH